MPSLTRPGRDRHPDADPRFTRGERLAALVAVGLVLVGVLLVVRPGTGTTTDPDPAAAGSTGATGAAAATGATGDERVFPGGRTLAAYRTDDPTSYRWRVAILDGRDRLARDLAALPLSPGAAELGDAAYERAVATCADLAEGVDAQRAAAQRWAGPDGAVKAKTARNLVAVIARTACPRLAPV